MAEPLANDYAGVARRMAEIAAGIEPQPLKPDCSNCADAGWVCVSTVSPMRWDECFACGNPKRRPSP